MADAGLRPVKVWAVRIGATPDDTPGILTLEDDALVFTLSEEPGELRIALTDVGKVKRVRGSPVLIVENTDPKDRARFAFYFIKPPPLKPQGRESRRKTKRKALSYLQTSAGALKDMIKAWESTIREAAARAKAAQS